MLNVFVTPSLRRLFGVIVFPIAVALSLSVPSFAVYYNLGMFWKGTAGAVVPTFTERKIAVGDNHGCAIISDGTVKCWGENDDGELGDGTNTQRTTPVTVSGLTGAISVDVKYISSCAVLSDGTAKCWGSNTNGQLGDGTTTLRNTPVAVSGLSGVVSIANGDYHSCAALSDGTAKCWGKNTQGQLGDGTTTQRNTPVAVSGLTGVISISAGNNHTCAALSDGAAKCWGDNANGNLGDGTTTQRNTPVAVSGLSGVVSISTKSYSDSCAVLSDGTAKCWGYNLYGQIGDGTTTQRTTPVAVSGLTGAVSIAVGGNNLACAALSDGTVKCWGRNNLGQLGDGTTTNRSTPVSVTGLADAGSITVGDSHGCSALSDGTIKCWGYNYYGQLGNGTTTNSSTYVSVTGSTSGPFTGLLRSVVSIDSGGYHTCAALSDGTAMCWGDNGTYGQLGDGSTTARASPTKVLGLSGAVSITTGGSHSCALLSDGTGKCWGRGDFGQLGNGGGTSTTPVSVSGLTGAVSITAYSSHTCAILSDGSAKCWGFNGSGCLGDGTTTTRSTPVTVSGLSGIVSIHGGASFTCAVLSDGTARCWGINTDGVLGNGTTTNSLTPVTVTGLTGATSIRASSYYTACATISDGTVKCWGKNAKGQLGNGTTTSSSIPVSVSGLSGVISISLGDEAIFGNAFGCAALADGTAKCWGANGYFAELGDGTTTDRFTPVTVSGLSGVTALSSGHGSSTFSCAMLSDGTAKCWGSGTYGQLGDGTNSSNVAPVAVIREIRSVSVATANNGAGASTLVIAKPARTDVGRLMIMGITSRPSTTTIAPPSGWTQLVQGYGGNIVQKIYYRFATSADDSATDYTWTLSSAEKASGVIVTYENMSTAVPGYYLLTTVTIGDTLITAFSLSTTPLSRSLIFYGISNDSVITGPSGYTTLGQDASTSNGATSRTRTFATEKTWATTPTGDVTATAATAGDSFGHHVVISPAP